MNHGATRSLYIDMMLTPKWFLIIFQDKSSKAKYIKFNTIIFIYASVGLGYILWIILYKMNDKCTQFNCIVCD